MKRKIVIQNAHRKKEEGRRRLVPIIRKQGDDMDLLINILHFAAWNSMLQNIREKKKQLRYLRRLFEMNSALFFLNIFLVCALTRQSAWWREVKSEAGEWKKNDTIFMTSWKYVKCWRIQSHIYPDGTKVGHSENSIFLSTMYRYLFLRVC